MKQRYDLIFSIGATCFCSQVLREAGLQHASFPYDWTFSNDFRPKMDSLCNGFADLFDRESLHVSGDVGLGRPCWQDTLGRVWPHDLRLNVPIDEQLPAVREKYARRVERLFRLLGTAHRTLAVYVDNKRIPTPTEEDIAAVRQQLARRWPEAGIEVLFVRHASKVRPENARITERSGYRIIDVDCCSYDGSDKNGGLQKTLGAFLAGLYEVVDYRTAREKREGPRKRRLAKYGKFAAKTFWGYHWNRLQYKLYHHLHKRMARKGLV